MLTGSFDRPQFARVKTLARRALFGVSALSLALYCASDVSRFAGALGSNALPAQSIINNPSEQINNFSAFSSHSMEKDSPLLDSTDATGTIDDAQRVQIDFPAPTSPAKQIGELSYRIPFVFPQGVNSESASKVELFCSDDQGASWVAYASIEANDGKKAFLFEAPVSGEYWFVLKTYFRNGKTAYSATRAYQFADAAPEPLALEPEPELNSFALNDEEPEPLPLADGDEQLYVDETVAKEADDPNASSPADDSFLLEETQEDEAEEQAPSKEVKIIPHPGKMRSVTLGKEDGTDKLMIFVRWFRPEDLEEQYRGGNYKLDVEHGPTKDGPWEAVGKDLSPKEPGYAWVATESNMKPFYVRICATDENGKTLTEVSPAPVDVSAVDLKTLFGYVRTPAPLTKKTKASAKNAKDSKDSKDAKNKSSEDAKLKDELSLIQTTSSTDEKETSGADEDAEQNDIDRSRNEMRAFEDKQKQKQKQSFKPPKERPYVPAPTNPNQLEFNPLFTRGVGVLYRSAQTRHASAPTTSKRSIFTPPSQAASAAPPAEYRRSASQLAARNAQKARERMEREARYAKEHEMETFNEKPELMEGRVFYMDSNGNMTTTPPAEFLQAQNNWQVTNVGDPVPANGAPIQGDPATNASGSGQIPLNGSIVGGANGSIYMPSNTDDYDASARSGAAMMGADPYVQNAASGSSPINQRYSNGANGSPAPNGTNASAPNGATYETVPNTSYRQSFSPGAIPYNYAPAPNAFPPQPQTTW